MPLPEIEEILQRFRTKEEKVETLLKEKSGSLDKSKENQKEKIFLSCEDVKKRNRNLMKKSNGKMPVENTRQTLLYLSLHGNVNYQFSSNSK
ncbi:uncharacterized protein LOC123316280 isoform X2 [Coccinella septempunctata]|uniref:uncharacterized protein LOC123316280 isoform X2 n=1 Tax=Coccinella septempunctata TaxID=41139 RepID=UPI001D0986BA|nr:uncharacterized protein LOC123316280 isoform X2 [Coccinella septempunctata]